MIRQNRRIGGGKSLINLGKVLLSAIVVSAVILNENAIAARRKSSKTTSKKGLRSASSKKSNSAKSTSKKGLRSASSRSNSGTGSTSGRSSRSSKRAATASSKVSNIRGLNSYSNSIYGNTTNYSIYGNTTNYSTSSSKSNSGTGATSGSSSKSSKSAATASSKVHKVINLSELSISELSSYPNLNYGNMTNYSIYGNMTNYSPSSSKSSKSAATASTKVSKLGELSSYSNSTYGNMTSYSPYGNATEYSYLNSKMEKLSKTMSTYANKILNLEKKNSDLETRLAKLEAGSVVTTQNVPLSTSSTTTSDGKLGYIKGSADLCKPDSSGHKYCSVAINVDKKYPGSSFCISYIYDKSVNSWRPQSKVFDMQTITGQINNNIKDFTKNKPTLFVMDDFSYYLGDENSRMILEKKYDRKYILLCGTGLGHNHTDTVYPTFDILDKKVKLYGYPGAYKVFNDAKGSIRHPFTSPSGDLVLFDVNGSPLIKWTGNSLEYSPNLSESYIKELKSYVRDGDNEEYFDVIGNKYKKN